MRFSTRKTCARGAGIAAVLLAWAAAAAAVTSYKQPGFSESAVFTGLTNPTVVRFLPDGRVLVAEKSGLIKLFPNLTDQLLHRRRRPAHGGPQLLGSRAARAGDRPELRDQQLHLRPLRLRRPDRRHAAALGHAGATSDPCPTPPGADDGRLRHQRPPVAADGRRRRLDARARGRSINDWCQQFPSHSIGALEFGADGYLYVSGGDGASFNNADWGQFGGSRAPPPTRRTRAAIRPSPSARRRPSRPPRAARCAARAPPPGRRAARLLNGADPARRSRDGRGAPGQPAHRRGRRQRAAHRRLRLPQPVPHDDPARARTRSGSPTSAGTRGRRSTGSPTSTTARNFGWPCYEGNGRASTRA